MQIEEKLTKKIQTRTGFEPMSPGLFSIEINKKENLKRKKKHNMKERERKHFYATTTPDELNIEELMYRAKEGI